MDYNIEGWLSFTAEVEQKLQSVNTDIFSDIYQSELAALLEKIRNEVSDFPNLCQAQKRESFLRINSLGNDLRLTAYFAH